ncbi:hypothetical protein CL617_02595 [archaeon]|nr:hypothetical protein [archaeon]|tara:strand:+ start:3555 stop:4412 length:858 start_codon:yes stop_codon:yes gene_type:complete
MDSKKIIELVIIFAILLVSARVANEFAAQSVDDSLERNEDGVIIGAETFYIDNNSTKSVLLLHGFGANPFSFQEMSTFFSDLGYNVYSPRLPGHGTSGFDLEKYSWKDWEAESERAYLSLRENSEEVYVLGYSMGGDLALNLAKKYDIDKLVTMNAPYHLLTKLKYAIPIAYISQSYTIDILFKGTDREKKSKKYKIYPVLPIKSFSDLLELVTNTKIDLESIEEDILIIQSKQDTLVDPESANTIYRRVSSKNKRLVFLEYSDHIEIEEYDKEVTSQALKEHLK